MAYVVDIDFIMKKKDLFILHSIMVADGLVTAGAWYWPSFPEYSGLHKED